MSASKLKVLSRTSIHPTNAVAPTTSPLSIADSAVAEYAPSAAVWLFRSPNVNASSNTEDGGSSPNNGGYDVERLGAALADALDASPHFAGRLHLDPPAAGKWPAHTKRFGRAWVSYGYTSATPVPDLSSVATDGSSDSGAGLGTSEPGVELTIATWQGPLADVLPPLARSASVDIPPACLSAPLVDTTRLVKLRPSVPGPGVVAQVTTFADGALALGVATAHVLTDAHSLAAFVRAWAEAYVVLGRPGPRQAAAAPVANDLNVESSVNGSAPTPATDTPSDSPRPTPVFSPIALDSHAAGDIDSSPDPALLAESDLVPQRRLDFWASATGAPPFWSAPLSPPAGVAALDDAAGRSRGNPVPWEEWEWAKPVAYRVFQWTPGHIETAYAAASADGTRLSRLDAVLGHMWAAVVRARTLPPDACVFLHTSVGLRARLGLGADFVGSPIENITASERVSSMAGPGGAGVGARAVRESISSLTTPRVTALLHRKAYALDPVREWNVFIGSRNVLTTSWLGIGAYDVDLGQGPPTFVLPVMPPCDGLLVAVEMGGEGKWYENGVGVMLVLQEEVMARLQEDPQLWPSMHV